MTIAVLGASGVIGRALVGALAESQDEVVAISRRPLQPETRGVRAVALDITNPAAVHGALDGVEIVYYLVHSLGTPDFSAVDRQAAETIAAEAARAGVAQIVYLGGLGDEHPDLSAHLRSRIRDRQDPLRRLRARDDAPGRGRRRPRQRGLRDGRLPRRPAASDDRPTLGLDAHAADRPRRRRALPDRRRATNRRRSVPASTSAARRS